MKTYVFLDGDGAILEQVQAEDHDDAVSKANGWQDKGIDSNSDFYSIENEDD